MNRLFLFCIGGTGSRVLKSLLFLMASGVKINAREIVPIIIDPDKDNGDVELTLRLLSYYNAIRQKAANAKTNFFGTEIKTLASVDEKGLADVNLGQGYRTEIHLSDSGLQGVTFRSFIEYDTLDIETKALMQLLYSEQNNLNADLTVGFKGNPHMGSVVLNRIKDSHDFEFFVNQLKPGDRVFIISSIFGGTGASGFPLLVKNIRQPDMKYVGKAATLKAAPLGAVSVLPYFGVLPNQGSAINKDTFISKTKAALSHYGVDLHGLNVLYYIGDEILKDYQNVEGSKGQMNQAHFVEMAAALAIIDFMDSSEGELQTGNLYKEFGVHLPQGQLSFDFKNLGISTRQQIGKPLTQLFYTWKHWQNRLPVAIKDNNMVYIKGNPATSSSPINASLIGSNFYQNNLKPFLEQFEKWLREMATNQRAFVPFNLDASELQHMVMNIQQKQKGMLFKSDKWDFKDFDTELNEAEKQTGGLTQEQKFLALFSIATEAIFQDRLQEAMS
jgi:hypothetical protein